MASAAVACRLCATPTGERLDRMTDVDDSAVQVRLGLKIKARREKVGISQIALAERSGIHRTYVNQVEHGRKNVTIVLLARMAVALGTTPSALTQGILTDSGEETGHHGV
ncbi:DNA-binding protein [Mycolicibacterium mucogenicum DSM 44124]|nr:DNA-binding protein [Mycolicibacterium mucogenicum DSM 44124]